MGKGGVAGLLTSVRGLPDSASVDLEHWGISGRPDEKTDLSGRCSMGCELQCH